MKKFIIIYHMPAELRAQSANVSPEEMKEGMKPWMEWAEKCGDNLIDLGNPLANSVQLDSKGNHEKGNSKVAGFSVLQAESMEEATELVKDHPHVTWNPQCTIEIHECLPLPQ